MDISALYKCFTECGKVTTDSRNCPEGSMFIALKGETFNGNAYALQALEKGCQYAVVDEKICRRWASAYLVSRRLLESIAGTG